MNIKKLRITRKNHRYALRGKIINVRRIIYYIFIAIFSSLLGFYLSNVLLFHTTSFTQLLPEKKEVIGFLPYETLSRAKTYYSGITTLAYFALTIGDDGNIVKLQTPQQEDPGWYALSSGKVNPFLQSAKAHNQSLALVVFSGNNDVISNLVSNPLKNGQTLAHDLLPVMHKYGFTKLNIDIEATATASSSSQKQFGQFIKSLSSAMQNGGINEISLDMSPSDFVKSDLIDPSLVSPMVNQVVVMAYDYHSTSSIVTGPVAPLSGAGISLEYDTEAAVKNALMTIPSDKLLLGMPLYGYEWDTLTTGDRIASIPGSGVVASNKRAEALLSTCANCKNSYDMIDQEEHVSYFDPSANLYHVLYYPTKQSTQAKITFAKDNNLGGVALWALGFEGSTILSPLQSY